MFMDLEEAYDVVDWKGLWDVLGIYGEWAFVAGNPILFQMRYNRQCYVMTVHTWGEIIF